MSTRWPARALGASTRRRGVPAARSSTTCWALARAAWSWTAIRSRVTRMPLRSARRGCRPPSSCMSPTGRSGSDPRLVVTHTPSPFRPRSPSRPLAMRSVVATSTRARHDARWASCVPSFLPTANRWPLPRSATSISCPLATRRGRSRRTGFSTRIRRGHRTALRSRGRPIAAGGSWSSGCATCGRAPHGGSRRSRRRRSAPRGRQTVSGSHFSTWTASGDGPRPRWWTWPVER